MTAHMQRRLTGAIIAGALAFGAACGDARAEAGFADDTATAPHLNAEETRFYRDMAAAAWRYLDRHYQPATGFVNATPDWYNTTLWDIGAQLLATHAARELGLIAEAEYRKRTRATLATLERVELFQGKAFNRVYSTRDGAPDTGAGAGWSATDLGRLLVALKVLAVREPEFAAQAERIVRRNDFRSIVRNGYLHGRVNATGREGAVSDFQEGRIGYEQYVAAGFSQWGADVRNALNFQANARPVDVLGVRIPADRRGLDRLLSEPFILHGLELGLEGPLRDVAASLLRAQEARYRRTGQVTIATEDAVAVKPHHFYYYCVYCNKKPFVVGVASPREVLDAPRWVSVKGAYGWHAIMPGEYTSVATEYVAPALDARHGWATGVYEGTRESTRTWDVNTAAVLLEIAYYQLRGRIPLIQDSPRPGSATSPPRRR
jgi:hypothetical protein